MLCLVAASAEVTKLWYFYTLLTTPVKDICQNRNLKRRKMLSQLDKLEPLDPASQCQDFCAFKLVIIPKW